MLQNRIALPYLSSIQSNVSDVNSYVTRSSINSDLGVPNVKLVGKRELLIQSHHDLE